MIACKKRADSTPSKIVAAAVTVAVLTTLVKSVSLFKELAVARNFGIGDDLDCFFVAWMFPQFLIGVINGAFAAAFVPAYIRARERARNGDRLLWQCVAAGTLMFAGVAAVLALTAPWIVSLIAAGFSAAKQAEAAALLLILCPTVALSGVSGIFSAALSARERFLASALAPICNPVVVLGFLAIGGRSLRIESLAWGCVFGSCLELAVLVLLIWRSGVEFRFNLKGLRHELRRIGGQFFPAALGQSVIGLTLIVDQSFAASLGPGAVSSLAYGYKLVAFAASILMIAIGSSTATFVSQAIERSDSQNVRSIISAFSRTVFLVSCGIGAVLFALSPLMVQLLFQNAAIDHRAILAVAGIQRVFAFQLPFLLVGIVYARVIASLCETNKLLFISTMVLVLDIIFDALLSRWFGAIGIAASTVICYAASMIVSQRIVSRLLSVQTAHRAAEAA